MPTYSFLLLIFSATGDVKLSRLFPADHLAVGEREGHANLASEFQNRGRPNSTDDHLMVGSTNSIFALLPIVMPQLIQPFLQQNAKVPQSSRAGLGVLINDTSFPEFAHLLFVRPQEHGDKTLSS